MRRSLVLLALALSATPAMPAMAEVYTVTLTNGSVLETAYQPQEAAFDRNVVLLMTDVGNWIGVRKDEIESVRSDAELGGYGKVIEKNTILLGWSANDAADPDAKPEGQGNGRTDPALSATAQALQNIYDQRQAEQNYSIKQFVQPNETQGIPARMIGTSPPQ
ncbi:MAG: hypothetical protein ABUT39_19170 [Acidobacteriota bacterium]